MAWLTAFLRAGAFLALIFFLPLLPPDFTFEYHKLPAPRELHGPLSLNEKLNKAEILFEDKIKGPESLAIFKDELYTGLHGGFIVKLVNNNLITILKTGLPCEGIWEEKICGRPLGLTFGADGFLYIADAYYGIIKANVTSGEKNELISINKPIDGKVPMIPNSVAVAKDGKLYWTDSSTTHQLENGLITILGSGTGRLIMYDPGTRLNHVLIENLAFPNGIALSSDENFLIVAETAKAQIIRYGLKGKTKGQKKIFVDRLPGLPDNLRQDGKTGFMVALVHPEDSSGSFRMKLASQPLLRKIAAQLLSFFDILFKKIDYYFPNHLAKRAAHWIGHFESFKFLLDKRVTVVMLDNEGQLTGSLHATDGNIKYISDIVAHNGHYYLGSPYNQYIARVKIQ